MSKDATPSSPDDHPHFTEELRLLAEAVLERVEPTLRRAAVGANKEAWASCDWCPVCAVTALVRGEHHDILGTLADHGTSVITVLREALAGVPVDPKLPDDAPAEGADEAPAPRAASRPTPDAAKLVNIPVTIKPPGATGRHTNGHNSTPWAPVG